MTTTKPNNILYTLSLCIPLLAIIGNLVGGLWTVSVVICVLLITIPDIFIKYPNKEPWGQDESFNDFLLVAIIMASTIALFSLFYGIWSGTLQNIFLWTGILNTGLAMGSIGNLTAHELIHRRTRLKYLGIWYLFLVSYTHYFIEHIQFHHRYVATDLDPSTAKRNENFYSFFVRLVSQQISEVWQYEKTRLQKKNKFVYGLDNFLIRSLVAKIIFIGLIWAFAGLIAVGAYLLVCVLTRFIHESITYAQHYGLNRKKGEKVTVHHSWQSNSFVSEYFTLALIRHSDHHWHATTDYPNLISYQEGPTLPTGYIAILPLIWIPPLWFRTINPILDKQLKHSN